MKKTPFFSIIMPAYNVEQYIRKAIESICCQTFADWELIVVDDCSPDSSGEIAEELATVDERIQVLHLEKNKGLSQARNTGEEIACGQYIWFMDSDDYVDATLLERVDQSLKENQAQIVVFGVSEEYYDQKGIYEYAHIIMPKEYRFSEASKLRAYIIELEQETLYGYAWNKIYNLSYLRQLRLQYQDIKLIEDILFNIAFCRDITSMNTLHMAPYHYAKRIDGSLTNKFVPNYFKLHKQRIESIYEQYQYWEACTPEVKSVLGSLYARYILSAMQRNCDKQSNMNHMSRYKWCRALFCQGLFNELIPNARAKDSKALSLLLLFLRWKKTILCLFMGRGVYITKRVLPFIYTKVKSQR